MTDDALADNPLEFSAMPTAMGIAEDAVVLVRAYLARDNEATVRIQAGTLFPEMLASAVAFFAASILDLLPQATAEQAIAVGRERLTNYIIDDFADGPAAEPPDAEAAR